MGTGRGWGGEYCSVVIGDSRWQPPVKLGRKDCASQTQDGRGFMFNVNTPAVCSPKHWFQVLR